MEDIMKEPKNLKLVKKYFEGKNYNEKALKFLDDFLIDFDFRFGKYLNKEEVIERIKNNVDIITFFKDKNTKKRGEFIPSIKKVVLYVNNIVDEDMMKNVFFHEMIHVLTLDINSRSRNF